MSSSIKMNQSELVKSKRFTVSKFRPFIQNSLLIYDKRLSSLEWIRHFPVRMPVAAGEKLKDLNEFPGHIEKILKLTEKLPSRKMSIVALGGGSVGDFAGFVASVFKRGVPLYQIPSTWLAAIDSAHGGKTALNAPPFKNQIGSFHPAEKVLFLHDLLTPQPDVLAQQALSELVKIALIDSRSFWKSLSAQINHPGRMPMFELNQLLWKNLEPAVLAKWKVIKKDPFEREGYRQILNLGHTFGHFIESEFKLSHGDSVAQGLIFACEWSLHKKLLSRKDHDDILQTLRVAGIEKQARFGSSRRRCEKILLQDKKKVASNEVNFIFLKAPGNVIIRPVKASEIASFAYDSGWIK